MTREEHFVRVWNHLQEKYAYGGYLHLYIPESPNAERLDAFRRTLLDKEGIRRKFDHLMDELSGKDNKEK